MAVRFRGRCPAQRKEQPRIRPASGPPAGEGSTARRAAAERAARGRTTPRPSAMPGPRPATGSALATAPSDVRRDSAARGPRRGRQAGPSAHFRPCPSRPARRSSSRRARHGRQRRPSRARHTRGSRPGRFTSAHHQRLVTPAAVGELVPHGPRLMGQPPGVHGTGKAPRCVPQPLVSAVVGHDPDVCHAMARRRRARCSGRSPPPARARHVTQRDPLQCLEELRANP